MIDLDLDLDLDLELDLDLDRDQRRRALLMSGQQNRCFDLPLFLSFRVSVGTVMKIEER